MGQVYPEALTGWIWRNLGSGSLPSSSVTSPGVPDSPLCLRTSLDSSEAALLCDRGETLNLSGTAFPISLKEGLD